jgi:hypothetical protein
MKAMLHRSSVAFAFVAAPSIVAAACNGDLTVQPILSPSAEGGASQSASSSTSVAYGSTSSASYGSASSSASTSTPTWVDSGAVVDARPPSEAAPAPDAQSQTTQCTAIDAGMAFGPACQAKTPTLPPGSVTSPVSTTIVAAQGATITITDGFATVLDTVSTGPLYTRYDTTVDIEFANYSNALGYELAAAVKQGSRILVGSSVIDLTSYDAQPVVAPGTYASTSGAWQLQGFSTNCDTQSESIDFGPQLQMNVASISGSRITGSLIGSYSADAGANGGTGPVEIDFDLPLILLCEDTYPRCCVP